MKRFLALVLIGCFVFISIAIVIELYQAKAVNSYSYKYNYMEEKSDGIKTLLLGNSLMENSINPHFLGDSVFDLAISARWIYFDVKLLEKYISKMTNINQVVFGMGYAIPFHSSYHFPGQDKDYADNQKYKYEKYMNIRYDRPPYYYWFGFLNGRIRMKTLKTLHDDCTFLQKDTLGYIGYDCLIGQQDGNWRSIQNIDPSIIFNPHACEQIKEYTGYLKEMARLCQQYDVRFIVITPPCHDSYIANVRQEGLDILHGMIDEIRAEYPIEYIDYLQDEGFRADSIYFNCSHLNSIGADMFALRVKKDFGL